MQARMLNHPGPRLGTVVAGEVVRDDVDLTNRIVGFDVLKQSNVVRLRCVRRPSLVSSLPSRTRSARIYPRFLRTPTRVQRSLDPVTCGRPAWGWREGTRHNGTKFISADGRRSRWWLRVVGDDRYPDCGQSLCREGFPNCGCTATARLLATGYGGSGCV